MTGIRKKLNPVEAERIITEEARIHGISLEDLRRQVKRTKRPVFFCRIGVAKRLYALGASTSQIGIFLGGIHSSTISYYLGGHTRYKPTKPPWKMPRIIEVSEVRKPVPKQLKRYKIPYAGADFREYQWQERT